MLHWIAHFVSSLNYWGVATLMAIENIVLPIPSELIMPLAGYRTIGGALSLWGVILAGTVGSVLGGLPLYYAGYALGEKRVAEWIDRYGRWLMLRKRHVDRAAQRFTGNEFVAVTIGQVLPGVRGLISIPAGLARMNVGLFLLANFIGTLVWCTVLAVAGRFLGANFTRIHQFLGPLGWGILGILAVSFAIWVMRRRHNR
ncbi:MAG: DedA family protein [Gemmatimonadaceae bacterium]